MRVNAWANCAHLQLQPLEFHPPNSIFIMSLHGQAFLGIWHGIKPGHERPLAEVRNEISDEIKRESANKKYAEQAESFSNMVYEQPDSLKPVVEKFHLTLQESPWLGKTGGEGPLGNAKLLSALFSDDAIRTSAIPKPSRLRPTR